MNIIAHSGLNNIHKTCTKYKNSAWEEKGHRTSHIWLEGYWKLIIVVGVNDLQGCDLCEAVHNTAVHTPSGSIEICTNAVVSGLDEFTKR